MIVPPKMDKLHKQVISTKGGHENYCHNMDTL